MASPEQFAKRMQVRAKQLETGVGRIVRKTALAIDRELIFSTPVDTGRARSNWVVNISSAHTEEMEIGDPATLLAFASTVLSLRFPGQPIHITNNLPYIRALNTGTSAQAPKGFVEEAIQIGAEVVRQGGVFKK